jgi:hypothetical protein
MFHILCSKRHDGEYTGESNANTNNSTNIRPNMKQFLGQVYQDQDKLLSEKTVHR